jgi:hypothetical protein
LIVDSSTCYMRSSLDRRFFNMLHAINLIAHAPQCGSLAPIDAHMRSRLDRPRAEDLVPEVSSSKAMLATLR